MNNTDTLLALAEIALEPGCAVPSPCVSVCRMDPVNGLCMGCWRDIDEIIAWGRMTDDGKRHVWRAIIERMQTPATRAATMPP